MPRASFSLQFPQGLRLWYFDCKIAAAIFFFIRHSVPRTVVITGRFLQKHMGIDLSSIFSSVFFLTRHHFCVLSLCAYISLSLLTDPVETGDKSLSIYR